MLSLSLRPSSLHSELSLLLPACKSFWKSERPIEVLKASNPSSPNPPNTLFSLPSHQSITFPAVEESIDFTDSSIA